MGGGGDGGNGKKWFDVDNGGIVVMMTLVTQTNSEIKMWEAKIKIALWKIQGTDQIAVNFRIKPLRILNPREIKTGRINCIGPECTCWYCSHSWNCDGSERKETEIYAKGTKGQNPMG